MLADFGRFIRATFGEMIRGKTQYYYWMGFLLVWMVGGLVAYLHQLKSGMIVTHMSDSVSWGAYIANFTYLVGMAAAAVMLVIPAYIYEESDMHHVVLLGELLAMAALTMCLGFVFVDIGRPDRFWHLIPGIGKFNWPISLLSWDVVVLNGYLILNFYITTYLLFCRFRGRKPEKSKYMPMVYLAIFWAVGIHTVTAFLYAGLGARPSWNAAILAPRFLASAFAAGPGLMIIALSVIRERMGYPVQDSVINKLRQIVAVAMMVNIFFFLSEIFTELYSGKTESASMHYLLFGLKGHHVLVPYIWSSLALNIFAVLTFTVQKLRKNLNILRIGCGAAIVGVWIEKGMGLVIPGFVPSPLGQVVDYTPSVTEFFVSAGIWAMGAFIFTLLLKAAVPIEMGRLKAADF